MSGETNTTDCEHGVPWCYKCVACEAASSLAAPHGSPAPDQTRRKCEACGGKGRVMTGCTGIGVSFYEFCLPCLGKGSIPVQENSD